MVGESISRRTALKATATAGVASIAGCMGDDENGEEPVRIGVLLPLSGAFALTGQENNLGTELATEYIGEEILGRDVELVVHDTGTQPDEALQGAQELVEQEGVDAIVGPADSAAALATIPYIQNDGQVPFLPTTASALDAREDEENCNPYTFFIWPSNRHTVPVGVDFIQDLPEHVDQEIDPDRVHFFSEDYALGQSNLELLEEEMEAVGGEVTGSTLVQLGEEDLSSAIAEMDESDADVITGVLTPAMAARLIRQSEDFGLTDDKVMMFNSGKPVDQLTQHDVGELADGWFGTYFYNPDTDTEINNEFHDLYEASDSDLPPNVNAGVSFEAVRALSIAMEEAGTTEPDDVIDELAGLTWESIFGDISFRAGDGQTEMDFLGATREDGEFVVLEEYPDVIGPDMCS